MALTKTYTTNGSSRIDKSPRMLKISQTYRRPINQLFGNQSFGGAQAISTGAVLHSRHASALGQTHLATLYVEALSVLLSIKAMFDQSE